jgi:(1->4)-alpha-D-glucan 1-alpha-D-glucosylmutase
MLWQTLLGSWPLASTCTTPTHCATAERIVQWQQKALREAKLQRQLGAPNEAYENACARSFERPAAGRENQQLRTSLA